MKPSYNATCQAVKILIPDITRAAHRAICGYPNCMTATNRYWRESYNILAWDKRKEEEQTAALIAAANLIVDAKKAGILTSRIRRRHA